MIIVDLPDVIRSPKVSEEYSRTATLTLLKGVVKTLGMGYARAALLVFIGFLLGYRAHAKFAWYETEQVPVARLFANLQQRFARNTNDFEVAYYLARLHSMAYSTNLVEVAVHKKDEFPQFYYPGSDVGVPESVQKYPSSEQRRQALSHLTNAIALYERAIVLLKSSTNQNDRIWMILPTQLGLAWCLDQAGRTNDAIAMYRKTLKIAWKREVTGDFDLKQLANDAWSDVRSGRNPVHSHNRGYIGPGVCFSEEIIGYLVKLLDPLRDASEIADLRKDQKTLTTMGRAVTPLIIPLVDGAAFADLVDEDACVSFDLDGSGTQSEWAWLTSKAAWLVFDANGSGRIDSGLQMFGSVTFWIFWENGYEALSSLDDNGDGIITGAELRGLVIWNDRNGDGVSELGEVVPVNALGIESISCRGQTGIEGMLWSPGGVTFTNGVSRATYDWNVPRRH